jgi:ABC-type amino acid transport substrate-binding protein
MNKFLQILSFSLLLFAFACDNKETKTLVVGTSADYPPFTFIHKNEVTGFDIDLVKEISRKLGYKLLIKNMNFSELMPALKGNKIDFGISAITATYKRAQAVDFSTKYHLSTLALLYIKNSPSTYEASLEGKTIAAQRGSTMKSFLKDNLSTIKNAKMVLFEKTSSALEELKKGQVDCILIELAAAKAFCAFNRDLGYSLLDSPTHDANYAIAFPRGSKLRQEFDEAMLKLKVSDEFDQLREKWFEPAN